MIRSNDILTNVRVASPCPANWGNMDGDDRVRYCGLCRLNVFNLSEMTEAEAAKLVSEAEGRLCVRYYQRRDGSVLTRDCPVGVRLIRKRLANAIACCFVLFAAVVAYGARFGRTDAHSARSALGRSVSGIQQVEPFRTLFQWIDPPQPAVTMGAPTIVGDVAMPPPAITGRVPIMGKIAAASPKKDAQVR